MAEFQVPLFGVVKPNIDIVVDVSNLAFRAAFRFKDLSHNGVPTGHVYGALSMLTALQKNYAQKHNVRLVYALDGKCVWRRDLLLEYKGNRGQRGATSGQMMQEVIDLLALLPGLTVRAPTEEADDVIAAHIASLPTKQHYVFSKDRDLWQLMHHSRVRIITSSKDPPITVFQISEDFYTMNPRLVPLAKALVGDTSDNIPGVKNFSRDDLRLILDEMSEPSVPDFLKATAMLDGKGLLKPRTLKLAQENVEHITRMLRITTLKADCQYESTVNTADQRALHGRLVELACTSMIEKTNVFFPESKR